MLESILRHQCKLDLARPVLAGVSGGPDSLCLLDILHHAGYLVIVAHFNHRSRPDADAESGHVAALAQQLGLPFITDSADVKAFADEHHLSIEESARMLRYRFLFSAARIHGAQAVAVGHTADDQVETILMHFLRGAGLSGLKGMEYRTLLPVFDPEIPIVRPLLLLWREDTENYCKENGLQPQYDASNLDQTYFRNRLRHVLIPELEKYNPRFKNALIRTAETLQDDHTSLQFLVDKVWNEIVVGAGAGWIAFNRRALAETDCGMRRNLLRKAGAILCPENRDFGFDALDRAAAFVESGRGERTDFVNGLFLYAEASTVYLASQDSSLPFAQWPQVDRPIPVTGQRVELENDWIFSLEYSSPDAVGLSAIVHPTEEHKANTWSVWLDADLAAGTLTIRPRRAGDRFTPFGLRKGSMKLQDFFVNEKLPQRARSKWPLLCVDDEIAWVVGFRISEEFRITDKTKRVMHVALEKK
jgi:tRNA(Ile)-lysidine synthase